MKYLTYIAKLLSAIFHPTFFTLLGFIVLFSLTYLSMLPWFFKLWVLAIVYVFTVVLPFCILWSIRKAKGWSHRDMYMQHRRDIVYITNMMCYSICMYVCSLFHLPMFIGSILVVCLMAQITCAMVNTRHKVSIHSTGTGLIIGSLVAYSFLFGFNPTWWLCIAILISGAVMSSRMFLFGRTLSQVLSGTLIGILCSLIGILIW